MSKEILSALVQLFAIFAKQDEGVSKDERESVFAFLKQTLNISEAKFYLEKFDKYAGLSKSYRGERQSLVSDSTKTLRICAEINKELTQLQKVIVTVRLLEMISAGGKKMTASEYDFLKTTVDIFNIPKAEFEQLQEFIFTKNLNDLDYSNFLVINSTPLNDKANSKHLTNQSLEGSIGVLHVESEDVYIVRYIGPQELFISGLAFRANRPYIFRNGSSIRGAKIGSIYYSDVVSEFLKDFTKESINFRAQNIHFTFPNGKIGLRGVDIYETEGKLIGFMGASGAGKSTLLNVLNGIEKPNQGKVTINGIDIHETPEQSEGVIGYIPQDDLLIESLTVFENLYFAAKLCFKDKNKSEIEHLVLLTIAKLGLREIKDLKVGSVLDKTISGGQRKRVNIGLELLREPRVLFVDEPTSGLSSRDSENIMDLLKELALSGKLVFVVIHQPSSDIFKLFDHILILDKGGYPVFYGNPIDSVIYFKQQTNQINAEEGECDHCGNVNPEQIFNIIETKVVDEYGHLTENRKITPEDWNEAYQEHIQIAQPKNKPKPLESNLHIPNIFSQVWIFLTRDVLAKWSNKQYLVINFLEAPLLALLLAYIVRFYNTSEGNHEYQYAQNENISAYIFISIIVALFMGLTVSAEEIIRDRKILKREQFLSLSWLGYLVSKLWVLFALSAIQTVSFVLIGNTILGVRGMYPEYWFVLFSVSCFANTLGLNISSAFKSVITIYILVPLLLIPQLILSGVVVKFDRLNPHVSNAKYVPLVGDMMVSRWAFEALAVTQARDNKFNQKVYDYNKRLAEYEFEKVYHVPHLEIDLDYCVRHINSDDDMYGHKLKILQTEVIKLTESIEGAEFENISALTPEQFNSEIAAELRLFLLKTKKYYIKLYNIVQQKKDLKLRDYRESGVNLVELKQAYHNEALDDLCKNVAEETRIFESEGELIQKIYPIYQTPETGNPLNYRTQFLFPQKNLFGNLTDTYWFNLLVIWTMSGLLFMLLCFNGLERLMEFFSNLL